jgi:hypothetical protein
VSRLRCAALVTGVLCLSSSAATAQAGSLFAPPPRISIITMGPGGPVWERFGHNMIRVTDSVAGTDIAYNFGIFDFHQKDFYWNFLQGRPMYALDPWPAPDAIAMYLRNGRSVEEQVLALSPEQARSLAQNLARNAQPDERMYRYDYFRDNCSTRVRDALNVVLAGTLDRDLSRIVTTSTYRSRSADLTAYNPAWYFGLMVLLGPATDRPLSAWEESFIPGNFAHWLATVRVAGAAGDSIPLVLAEASLPARDGRSPLSFTELFALWLAIGVMVGLLLAWTGQRAGVGRGRGGFVLLGGLWSLLSGFAGLIMVYLWAFTDHVVAYRNENILQASILGLALFVVMAAWARRGGPAPQSVRMLSMTIAVLSLAGLALQVLPWFSQVNGVALAFFVPANLGMAYGASRAAPPRAGTPTAPTGAPPSRP